jgi:hypothetical protein
VSLLRWRYYIAYTWKSALRRYIFRHGSFEFWVTVGKEQGTSSPMLNGMRLIVEAATFTTRSVPLGIECKNAFERQRASTQGLSASQTPQMRSWFSDCGIPELDLGFAVNERRLEVRLLGSHARIWYGRLNWGLFGIGRVSTPPARESAGKVKRRQRRLSVRTALHTYLHRTDCILRQLSTYPDG